MAVGMDAARDGIVSPDGAGETIVGILTDGIIAGEIVEVVTTVGAIIAGATIALVITTGGMVAMATTVGGLAVQETTPVGTIGCGLDRGTIDGGTTDRSGDSSLMSRVSRGFRIEAVANKVRIGYQYRSEPVLPLRSIIETRPNFETPREPWFDSSL